jgi:Na+-translocating ferredoxin:NAD+ oxidoreductase subunit G
MREITRLVVILTLICAVTAGALETLRSQLAPRIEMQEDLNLRGPALSSLFAQPAASLLQNKVLFQQDDQLFPIFYLVEDGVVTRLVVEATSMGGYGGQVSIMVGLDLAREQLIGMEIVKHSETPGVGSKIEQAPFRGQWQRLSSRHEIELGSQVAAISGASYSSRAVVDATNKVIQQLQQNEDAILALIEAELN